MCSQRSTECTRRRSGRLRRTRCVGPDGSRPRIGAPSSLLTTTILDMRSPDLLVAGQVRGDRLGAEREVLLHELVAPVLARRRDDEAIRPLLDDVAPVVAPVPHDAVRAGWTRRARHAGDEIRAAGVFLLALAAEPATQLADVARAAARGVHPQAEGAHALPLGCLDPH